MQYARVKAFDEADMVQKAKALFHQKGYEGTSMQDLIDTLGISRSSLYDTSGDKYTLYCKTLQAYCDENAYQLAAVAAKDDDPLQFIHTIFEQVIDLSKKDADKKGCYVVNAIVEFADRDTGVKEIVDANNAVFEKMLESLIRRAQQQKQVPRKKMHGN